MEQSQILNVLLAAFGGLLSFVAAKISGDLTRLTSSVEQLNIKIASILEKISSHEKRIENLEIESMIKKKKINGKYKKENENGIAN